MPPSAVDHAFNLALQHHQAGRLQHAEPLYRQILSQDPTHANTLNMLGVLSAQTGRLEAAADLLCEAIALQPLDPLSYNNLGSVLKTMGQLEGAADAYRRAIELNPNYSEAHGNLGGVLRDQGQPDAAIAACRKALALKPDSPAALINLANGLTDQGHFDEAIAAFRRAVVLQPNNPEAYSNLGSVLQKKGLLDEAIASCRQAISLWPNLPEAHNNLGLALKESGRLAEAIAACRQAIALRPAFAEAHGNLGIALKEAGQLDEAIVSFRQAIALKPAFREACGNLGNALKDQGRLEEATAAYRHAIALHPDFTDAHSNLLLNLNYHPAYDARAIADELARWNRQHAEPLHRFIQPHLNDPDPNRRLRIGYVSADFHTHASALFLMPLLQHHDAQQVEVFCYAEVLGPDAITGRFQQLVPQWRSTVGLSDAQVAQQIRADRIDILVDLKLHTAHNRLLVFAHKPAPVQATWLGYPGSTGLTTIDYRLSDPHLDPPGLDESVYSERTLRLPDTFWCYDPLDGRDLPVSPLPALANGFITFGCLNNFSKVNDAVLRLWSSILQAVPSSRLLLLAPEGSHRAQALQLLQEGAGGRVAPQRIEFVTLRPRRQYLELYHRIDLALDTFPCNGHTTSFDSFWMGVPVLTLPGPTAMGRAGLSQLINLNLPELIAQSPAHYARIAAALADDLPRLAELRAALRGRMQQSPLMDAPRFARNIEAAYRQMWQKHGLTRNPADPVLVA